MELQEEDLRLIAGGGVTTKAVEAILIGAQIYDGTASILLQSQTSILDSTQVYVKFGQEMGELLFNVTHPDPLGKMEYYPSDF